ncbi:hypothetical protein [Nocardia camponoti]|uniref:Uncharacterized protein n=1 Tax=Nocardia camponoti TaxID=1616106 RepID=A0A917V3X2_9NOCA|nr:hypothetical protein [Nocardia camponoti]GGK36093.1 hypothetical protein GCM10011591_04670 [Nocardia camponoti]
MRPHFPDDAWVGLALVGLGFILVVVTLAAVSYGLVSVAVVVGVLCGVCLVGGVVLAVNEHEHAKRTRRR